MSLSSPRNWTSYLRAGIQLPSPAPSWLSSKESTSNAGDTTGSGSIPGSGRSFEKGNGNPFQYFCLGNPMDRGAWGVTVHGITKGQTKPTSSAHTLQHPRLPSGPSPPWPGTSLVVQWFRLHFQCKGHGLNPWLGKIPHVAWHGPPQKEIHRPSLTCIFPVLRTSASSAASLPPVWYRAPSTSWRSLTLSPPSPLTLSISQVQQRASPCPPSLLHLPHISLPLTLGPPCPTRLPLGSLASSAQIHPEVPG